LNTHTLKRATAGVGSAALVALGFLALAPQANATASVDVSVSDSASASSSVNCIWDWNDFLGHLTYTFDGASGNGSVTLLGDRPLCNPFYVEAAAYAFASAPAEWPQLLIGASPIITVQQPGTQEFHAPGNGCGQVDVYADFDKAALTLSPTLTSSHTPYEPSFLDYFGSYKGGLTWYVNHSQSVTPTTSSPAPTTTSPAPTTTSPAPTTTSPAPTTTTPVVSTTAPTPVVSGTSATNTTTATTTTAAPTTTTPGASVSGVSLTNTPSPTPTSTTPSVLPFTGGNVGTVAGFGALGILAGLALMIATRKPRRQ
jgi:hypothetical protein